MKNRLILFVILCSVPVFYCEALQDSRDWFLKKFGLNERNGKKGLIQRTVRAGLFGISAMTVVLESFKKEVSLLFAVSISAASMLSYFLMDTVGVKKTIKEQQPLKKMKKEELERLLKEQNAKPRIFKDCFV